MSKYTTEVRFICETEAGLTDSVGFNDVDSVIEAALPHIFSFDFPIFDEDYRSVIETKILRHYYTREIGMETYGLWKLRLQTKLNEIMPFYNKLYESELLKYNPLYDVDMTTTNVGRKTGEDTRVNRGEESRTNSGTAKNTESNTNVEKSKTENSGSANVVNESEVTNAGSSENTTQKNEQTTDKYSDTPQGSLSGLLTDSYLTNARIDTTTDTITNNGSTTGVERSKDTSDNTHNEAISGEVSNAGSRISERTDDSSSTGNTNSQSVGTSHNTEDYVMHVFGKSAGANYAKMIKDFRDNLLNIDMDVINDLADLFMLIW